MPADIRAYTSSNLGRVVSGSIADSYLSGGVGLVKTKGHVIVQGYVVPRVGAVVTITADGARGYRYQLPRYLRVLSSCIQPTDRTTRVEVGCRLTYFEDLQDPATFKPEDDFFNDGQTEADNEIVTTNISASSIFYKCCAAVGVSPTSSLSSVFVKDRFDFSAGYVPIMDGLLASEAKVGYLTSDTTLQVVTPNLRLAGERLYIPEKAVLAVSPMGIGQLPVDQVYVNFNSVKLRSDDQLTDDPADSTEGFSSRTENNFQSSQTSSYTTITVPYRDPGTQQQATAQYDVVDKTSEVTEYAEQNGNRVLIYREQTEEKSSVAVAGAMVTDYLSAGVSWGSGRVEATTTETFSYDKEGRETRRELVREGARLYGLGSVGLPMAFENGATVDLVPVPSGTMTLERVVVETYRSGGYTKTVTSRYGPWIQTPQGQQTIAEAREYFDTAAKVSDFIDEALSGSHLLDVSISTQWTGDEGVVSRSTVSSWDEKAPALTSDEANAANEWRVEQSVDSTYVVGTGADPFAAFTFVAPDTGGLTAGQITAINDMATATRTANRRIVVSMPYQDDDRIIKISSSPDRYIVVKGSAESQARRYGQLYAEFLTGVRYGLSLQLVPRYGPKRPLEAFSVTVTGAMPALVANAMSWTLSADGVVLSMDALYGGAIGGSGYSFPVADGVSVPVTAPTPTSTEPTTFLGTVADVGGDPQTFLNATYPAAVAGEATQDLTTLKVWEYDGALWVDLGVDPGEIVDVVEVLPHTTITESIRLRSRHRPSVVDFDYALTLPVVTVELVTRTELEASSIMPIAVPSAALAVAAVAPTVGISANVVVPSAAVSVAAVAPAVATGGGAIVPSVNIAVAGIVPTIPTAPNRVDVPAVDIVVAAVAPVIVTDADVNAYLEAVETADAQELEPAVWAAVNTFVLGCKSDGIWADIQAACILAGARTLTGALTPLKGTAPTNNNFVSGDYNRETGLLGDGSSKHLDSNRANNADGQNDAHISVYASTWGTTTSTTKFPIGRQIGGFNERGLAAGTAVNSGNLSARVQSTNAFASHGSARVAGFVGASRVASGTVTVRNNGSTTSVSQTSTAPSSPTLFVFASSNGTTPGDGGTASAWDDSRLAFYSIGSGLDLALLDSRVTTLMTDLAAAIA